MGHRRAQGAGIGLKILLLALVFPNIVPQVSSINTFVVYNGSDFMSKLSTSNLPLSLVIPSRVVNTTESFAPEPKDNGRRWESGQLRIAGSEDQHSVLDLGFFSELTVSACGGARLPCFPSGTCEHAEASCLHEFYAHAPCTPHASPRSQASADPRRSS